MYRVLSAAATSAIVAASVVLFSVTAYAHEVRTVGPYQVAVGWVYEPTYVGQLNSLELRVTDTRNKQPVTGLEKTLAAEVSAGGLAPFKLDVSASDEPGVYNGWVIPTVAGSYTFHIVGKIDTQTVDEKFTSGPNTFGDVDDTATLQYPTKYPVADDLGKRLDAISSGIDQTRIIAIIGLALGVLALGAATVTRRRKP